MMLVRFLVIGEKLEPFNSHKMDKCCEMLKAKLLNDTESLDLFKTAIDIFNSSNIDKEKSRYKAESDTDLLIQSFRTYNKLI